MRTRIVKIGNSQGVRIPKALLEESDLQGDVDMSVHDGTLVIAPAGQARQGWAEALAVVPDHELERDQADLAAFRETPHDWDRKDWEW